MLERSVERLLGRKVRAAGGRSLKWVSPGTAGVPDRIVILPGGKVYFVELKQLGGKARQLQLIQQARLRQLGCQVYTLAGSEDVQRFMEEVTKPDGGV